MLKKIFIIILCTACCELAQVQNLSFGLNPSIGITFTNTSVSDDDKENLEWLLNFQANLNYISEDFQFDSDLFINFGQVIKKGTYPEKTQDNFILNIMPSIKLFESPSVRLFLQTKIETQLKEGLLDNQTTGFFDPAFLTHTLFIGDKNHLITQTDEQTLQIVYGIGYSFQQIVKKHFQLESETQPNNKVEYIEGPTAVFNLTFTKKINDVVNTSVSLNSLLLAKKDFLKSSSNSRFSSLLLANLNIGLFSIQYTTSLVFDNEISKRRSFHQSIVLGVKFDL